MATTSSSSTTQKGYPKFNPIRDLISGFIMATTSIPQLIAYAETVGYASYRGLHTAGVPLLVWGCVSSHPYINSGVTAITALMTNVDCDGDTYKSIHGEEKYVQLVAAYTFFIGFVSIILAICTNFPYYASSNVPVVIRTGFRWGCSVNVLLSALPNGFLYHGMKEYKQISQQNIWFQSISQQYSTILPGLVNLIQCCSCMLFDPIQYWNRETTIMFLTSTIFMMMKGCQYIVPKKFILPGLEVIVVTVVAVCYSVYTNYEGAIVGTIPNNTSSSNDSGSSVWWTQLIPIDFVFPNVQEFLNQVPILIEQVGHGSMIQFIISTLLFAGITFISYVGLASIFESENGIPFHPRRELVALGVTDIISGLFIGSAPVGGSLSRSLVGRMTGTTCQLTSIVTALIWMYGLPYLTPCLTPIPKAVLSAIIVSAVLESIIYPKELIQYITSGNCNWVTIVTAWGTGIITLCTSPTQGFLLGVILYIVIVYIFKQPVVMNKKNTTVSSSSSKEKKSV